MERSIPLEVFQVMSNGTQSSRLNFFVLNLELRIVTLTGTRQSPNILVFIFPNSDSWEMKVSYYKLTDLFLVTE